MKKLTLAVIALIMTIGSASAQQYMYVWKSNGLRVAFPVIELDSVGFYNSPTYSLAVTVTGDGTVTGAGEYRANAVATLTATAAVGNVFSQWSDGITDNPREVTMTKDMTLTAVFTAASSGGSTGGIGVFSISETEKVTFSPGNLQFNAALGTHQCADGTTKQGTWRFAEHQWDVVGMGYGLTNASNTVGGTVTDGDNRQISSTYNGWIDLFGWGTSGWESGANCYQPWSTSKEYKDYYLGGNYTNNLNGSYAYADWGVYNQIGKDAPGSWRTLTKDEWVYLFLGRTNYANLFGLGTVNGVSGTILLPDNWETPSGLIFIPSTTQGLEWNDYDKYYCYSSNNSGYSHNTYTSEVWSQMEAAGAVFLPTAGGRIVTTVNNCGKTCYYWSSTHYGTYSYWVNTFYTNGNFLKLYGYENGSYQYGLRGYGNSVRLVRVLQ